jgi:hypothetical protein
MAGRNEALLVKDERDAAQAHQTAQAAGYRANICEFFLYCELEAVNDVEQLLRGGPFARVVGWRTLSAHMRIAALGAGPDPHRIELPAPPR